MENKLFALVGLVAVVSGVFLALQDQYVVGIAGAIVGLGLLVQNVKKIREQSE